MDWNATPVTYGYDLNGNVTSKVTPGGIVDLKIWDANDAMTSAGTGVYGGQVYAHWDFTRNLDSQVASSTRGSATPVGTDQQYGYDTNTQLTNVSDTTTPANSVGFGYDPARHPTTIGERTQTFTPSGETCWTAPTTSTGTNPVCGTVPSGAVTYGYDLNGNRTTTTDGLSTQSFTWNPNSQLTAVNTPGNPAKTATYSYAADGLRVTKNVAGTNTVFAWDDTTNAAALIQDGNNYYIYGPDGLPTQRIGTSPTMFLHHDNYNTTRLTTDALGAVTSTQTFDAWGNQTTHTGTPPTLGWNSQYQDPETGLYYLRNRYYNPTTTQFLSPDPLFTVTGDRYGYAYNDPINGSDPTGLWCLVHNNNGGCKGSGVARAVVATPGRAAQATRDFLGVCRVGTDSGCNESFASSLSGGTWCSRMRDQNCEPNGTLTIQGCDFFCLKFTYDGKNGLRLHEGFGPAFGAGIGYSRGTADCSSHQEEFFSAGPIGVTRSRSNPRSNQPQGEWIEPQASVGYSPNGLWGLAGGIVDWVN